MGLLLLLLLLLVAQSGAMATLLIASGVTVKDKMHGIASEKAGQDMTFRDDRLQDT